MRKDLQVGEGKPGLPGRMLWSFGSIVARFIYNRKFNVQLENWQVLENLEPPYLMVGNHVMNYDPIIISANQKHLIHWVANDAVFRHPLLRRIFLLFQTIPKTKGMSDLDTVKIIHRRVREGGVVAVFPEGQTCWDGLSQPLIPATAKLVKLLKVPVVGIINKGGYLTQPRWVWMRNLRKSRIILEARLLLLQEDVKSFSIEEISERLNKGLFHDDFQFQKENPFKLESRKRAETLELFIYLCPQCGTMDSLVSQGNEFECQKCKWGVHVDEFGCFPQGGDFPFESLYHWGQWQEKETGLRVRDYVLQENQDQPLLQDEHLTLLTGSGLVPLKPQSRGGLKLWKGKLEFIPEKGSPYVFPITEMDALSIFKQQKLEFYFQKILYRFHFGSPRDSAYKWLKFLSALIDLTKESA